MNRECFFCEEKLFSLNKSVGLACKDSIIFEDKNVFITPDIAPLIEGHFLIVTKKHLTSFGGVNDQIYKSLKKAKKFLRSTIYKNEKVLFFEHGSVVTKTAGACIDHAHIHAIPIVQDINVDKFMKEVVAEFITSEKQRASRDTLMRCADNKQPYLFYENDEEAWYYPVDKLPSQLFRIMVAYYYTKTYNWKLSYQSPETKELFKRTLALAKWSIDSQQQRINP